MLSELKDYKDQDILVIFVCDFQHFFPLTLRFAKPEIETDFGNTKVPLFLCQNQEMNLEYMCLFHFGLKGKVAEKPF